jgi:hypothetical protein
LGEIEVPALLRMISISFQSVEPGNDRNSPCIAMDETQVFLGMAAMGMKGHGGVKTSGTAVFVAEQ